jgi:hypothetical protein
MSEMCAISLKIGYLHDNLLYILDLIQAQVE